MDKILIIDDDKNILKTLQLYFKNKGYLVIKADCGNEGINQFLQHNPKIVFLDMKLPDKSGLEVLKSICDVEQRTHVIVITAYATIETAVEAMKIGAFDYLPKPFIPKQIDLILEKLKKYAELECEIATLKGIYSEGGLLTRNRQMKEIIRQAKYAADSSSNIILSGESGTGKGLLAKLIHSWSPRRKKPFVTVDCTSFQENLLESDLFGHVKGAFTGAVKDKSGKLKLAEGGTAFLDEVSEIPYSLQGKLLRFLQSREYERMGDPKTYEADVRIIAATNKDLGELVQEGNFRKDLFYRLNVLELFLPPLRDRLEDVQLIAEEYLNRFSRINSKKIERISNNALTKIQRYNWPGNVRELINCIERGVVLSTAPEITTADLPIQITEFGADDSALSSILTLSQMERDHLQRVMQKTSSYDEAARILGIDTVTLWRKRKKYNIE